MKKITFIAAFLVMSLANAQISKGSKLIGTSFAFGSISGTESTTTYSNTPTVYSSDGTSINFGISPSIGYFVMDGFAIGAQVNASFYHSKSESSNTGSSTTSESTYNQPSVYVGPYARYYFVKGQKMSPYAQVEASVGLYPSKSESVSSTGSSSTTKSNSSLSWDSGVKLGFEYFISDYVGINVFTGFSYSVSNTEYDYTPSSGNGYSYTSDYKRWNIPVGLGLQIHLPSKK